MKGKCPTCRSALQRIAEAVPLKILELYCACGSSDFDFVIKSVATIEDEANERRFPLDVSCHFCKRPAIRKLIGNLGKLRKIEIELSGIELELK